MIGISLKKQSGALTLAAEERVPRRCLESFTGNRVPGELCFSTRAILRVRSINPTRTARRTDRNRERGEERREREREKKTRTKEKDRRGKRERERETRRQKGSSNPGARSVSGHRDGSSRRFVAMFSERTARRARPGRRGVVNKPVAGAAPHGSESGSARDETGQVGVDPIFKSYLSVSAVESRAATCEPHLPTPVRHPTTQPRKGGGAPPRSTLLSLARPSARCSLARSLGALAATRRRRRQNNPAPLPRRTRRRPGHPRRPAARSRHALSYRHHRGELGARSLCPVEIRTSTVRHVQGNTCWATTRIKRATARRYCETRRDVASWSLRCPSSGPPERLLSFSIFSFFDTSHSFQTYPS